mmetsp:Transcript_112455/g.223468  ORF Transcript_112455/g.223468 Transcript_112455/m.223468 type:complete len:360 (+) Transcript_112455:52-1131(+)|eukprot:CAMPEP_0172698734 /NCGR_PEP_ID=MMETSP1074-20121228/29676_1 /TAXON_ID=2916 /ORGANISM="Ceratium fusus, Strain PA161109" /LENGTH=359 /DNA_ID=CAMNT_0013519819 /DNA_START=33 /DNA_END=1112 /DNA_ORIENTATION=+
MPSTRSCSTSAALAVLTLAVLPPSICGALRRKASQWPTSLDLSPPPPEPKRQWRLPAEIPGWPQARSRFRRRHMRRALKYSKDLKDIMVDDMLFGDNDSFSAHPLRPFAPGLVKDTEAGYWLAVCRGDSGIATSNSTNLGNASNASNSSNTSSNASSVAKKLPLDGWTVDKNISCGGEPEDTMFTDESQAESACGTMCASVADIGCERRQFRICKVGARDEPSSNGTCLRRRLPMQRAPSGKPRPPREPKFWKEFCERGTVYFRMLFSERLCVRGMVLPGAYTEAGCAELASENPLCSDIFDIKEGPPAVCRCVLKGKQCQPSKANGSSPGDAAIYILRPQVNISGNMSNSPNATHASN